MPTIQTLDHVFNNDTLMMDAKLGGIFGIEGSKRGEDQPIYACQHYYKMWVQFISPRSLD
jgi:hypothetical protein